MTSPPTALTVQPGSVFDGNTAGIITMVAVKGLAVAVGTDTSGQNYIACGSQKTYFYTDLAGASLAGANFDYAIGTYDAGYYAGYESGSFLWPYRANAAVISVPNDTILAVAKNANVFLDLGLAADGVTPTANLLTVVGNKLNRVPYTIPAADYTANTLNSVAINSSGLAVVDVYANQFIGGSKRKGGVAARRALWNRVNPPMSGSLVDRFARTKNLPKPTTTSGSPSGYYLLSPGQAPIAMALPTGASSATVLAINDQGISVGFVTIGYSDVPYYWDAQGNAYAMQLPSDLSEGYAYDINGAGTVVGGVANDLTGYAVMWNAVNGSPTNLNTLVSSTFPFDIQYVSSIGNDFTMAGYGNPKANANGSELFGLQPH